MSKDRQRTSLLGGRNGFQQIPDASMSRSRGNSPTPQDATVDIPLTTVSSKTGSRKQPTIDMNNEKLPRFGIGGGGRRRKNDKRQKDKFEEDGITAMGRIYDRILNFSIVTRYLLYILPVGALISIPIIIGATVTSPDGSQLKIGDVRIVWLFSWVLTVWVGLWASKLFAKLLPWIFQFLCGIVSSGTRKYSLILKALEIQISLVGWALVALATFQPIMTNNPDDRHTPISDHAATWEGIVQRVLAAILASALIFLAERLFIQLISISYHRMQYDLKIKESKHNVWVLSILYEASIALFPAYCPEFAEEDYVINDSPQLPVSKSTTGHNRSGSATPMRLLANVGRFGDNVTAAFGHMAHEVTGKEVFNPTSSHSIIVEALEKKRSSEALAKRIWMSMVVEGKDALYQEDVIEVLSERSQTQSMDVFQALDRDGNGDVSLDEMILWVCGIGRERKAITSSLHDVDQAINVLDSLLCTIVFGICVFVFIAFLNSSFVTTLATAGTALLSLSFVFSTTAQELLGSCIFLFVKHPFDVGDRVDIGTEQLVVERISLLYSVFKNIKNHKSTQCPNVVLNNLWIDNVTRSKSMREQLLIYISFDTTLEDVQLLRREMQNFVLDKENNRDFESDIDVEVTGIAEMNKLELKVEIRHKSNWSNESIRASRRSKFMCALVLALRKIPIYAPGGGSAPLGSADQPSYSVSVSNEQAEAARDTFAKTKEAKRHKPSKPSGSSRIDFGLSSGVSPNLASETTFRDRSPAIGSATETDALNILNARSPTNDPAHDWQTKSDPSQPLSRSGPNANSVVPTDNTRAQDLDEVYGLLRRQSTRGKRRESYGLGNRSPSQNQGIPTIEEPSSTFYSDYDTRPVTRRGESPPRNIGGTFQVPVSPQTATDRTTFGTTYNSYSIPAPRYEYPPGSPQSAIPSPTSVFPKPPASVITQPGTGSGRSVVAQSPTVPGYPQQGATSRPGGPGRKNSFAAELEAERR